MRQSCQKNGQKNLAKKIRGRCPGQAQDERPRLANLVVGRQWRQRPIAAPAIIAAFSGR
jgi:hypothetical protein